jgi:hypothetical protein
VLLKRTIPQMGEIEAGSDGTIGWMKNPMLGGYTLVEGDDLRNVTDQVMHIRLLNLRTMLEQEYTLGDVAAAEFDGARCYALNVTRKREDAAMTGTMFFDADSGLIRGMDMTESDQKSAITLGDWKRIEGVSFFHRMKVTGGPMDMDMTFTEIAINSVDPKVFEVPEEVKELAKKQPVASDGTLRFEDFSPPVQKMITDMQENLPWDDAAALSGIKDNLASQADKLPGEYGKAMKYLLGKIDTRLAELGG